MTMKHGIDGGLLGGLICWLIYRGYLTFTPAPIMLKDEIILLAVFIFILSIGTVLVSAVKGSAVFGTTGDGLIYGFTLAFDILYVVTQLLAGKLPLP